jgi:hypothetical protein
MEIIDKERISVVTAPRMGMQQSAGHPFFRFLILLLFLTSPLPSLACFMRFT